MKQLGRVLMAAAVATMAVAPAAAAPARANPAASLSLGKASRAGSPAAHGSKLAGGDGMFIALGVGVLIIIGIIIAGSEGSKTPSSP